MFSTLFLLTLFIASTTQRVVTDSEAKIAPVIHASNDTNNNSSSRFDIEVDHLKNGAHHQNESSSSLLDSASLHQNASESHDLVASTVHPINASQSSSSQVDRNQEVPALHQINLDSLALHNGSMEALGSQNHKNSSIGIKEPIGDDLHNSSHNESLEGEALNVSQLSSHQTTNASKHSSSSTSAVRDSLHLDGQKNESLSQKNESLNQKNESQVDAAHASARKKVAWHEIMKAADEKEHAAKLASAGSVLVPVSSDIPANTGHPSSELVDLLSVPKAVTPANAIRDI